MAFDLGWWSGFVGHAMCVVLGLVLIYLIAWRRW